MVSVVVVVGVVVLVVVVFVVLRPGRIFHKKLLMRNSSLRLQKVKKLLYWEDITWEAINFHMRVLYFHLLPISYC